jgi:hypothetical protein
MVCNPSEFGPPRACSARFTLPMGSSPGFGSVGRNSPRTTTRRLILQKARRHSTCALLRPARGARFQALFHSPWRGAFHRSLTVLVPYRSSAVFSLGWWSTPLPTRFRVSGGTYATASPRHTSLRLRDSHPLRSPLPATFGSLMWPGEGAVVPSKQPVLPPNGSADRLLRRLGLGSTPFARRYSGHPLSSSGY